MAAVSAMIASLGGCEAALGLDDARTRTSNATATRTGAGIDAATPFDSGDMTDGGAETEFPGAVTKDYVVSSLRHHTCAVADDRAYCWGDNTEGQLGDGTTEPRDRPVQAAPFDDVVDVSAGYTHSCLVRRNADVHCWGKNERGQLGDGTYHDRHDASLVSMSGAVKVGVAGWHTCAITQLRGVRCWGDNYYGALGDGTFEQRTSYVDVQGLSDVVSLAVGVMHNCAATAQGHVYCWGRAVFGEDGYLVPPDGGRPDPNDPGSPVAQRIAGLNDVVHVAAGEDHTCATRLDGRIVCWGRNDYTELGDGTEVKWRSAFAPVGSALPYAVQVAAGQFTSCATVGASLAVQCWGQNNFGQLGNGNTSPGGLFPSPPIEGLTGIQQLAVNEHGCAWTKDRRLFCWGRNDLGQLGLGHVSDYELRPAQVTFPAPAPVATP